MLIGPSATKHGCASDDHHTYADLWVSLDAHGKNEGDDATPQIKRLCDTQKF